MADRGCCGDPACGYPDVADRMDRWAAAGYQGSWTDTAYDPPGPDGGTHDGD